MAESRIEQLYDDIVNGNTSNIIPQSRNEAYLKAIRDGLADGSIGGGGSGGTTTITDEQYTAMMNEIFGGQLGGGDVGGGSGGSVGTTTTITDEQVTAGMNEIFGEGNWSE